MSIERTWAGTHTFAAAGIVGARSIDEMQRLVAHNPRVRALGTRHSFTDLADSTGVLVTTLDIPPEPVLDEAARTVTVGGGIRYGVLADWLEQRGWALHNLGSLPHISVAGATATGTHGSGDGNGILATAIAGLEYVGADAELHRARRGDPDFAGTVVSLGAIGIVTRVTLELQPSFAVRQDMFPGLAFTTLLDEFDAVTSASYSVSVFTRWVDETVDVWRKTRLDSGTAVPDQWLGAARDPSTALRLGDGIDNVTPLGGLPGPWSQRLPHFRLDSTPSNGDEIQSEYFVDRADAADALRAVHALRERIAPHLLVSELRTAAADELWLSGAYQRDVLAIHFTWKNEPDAVAALLPDIESALRDFDARPHWGKVNTVSAAELERVHPRFGDARELFARLDPEGRFSNAALERFGLRERR